MPFTKLTMLSVLLVVVLGIASTYSLIHIRDQDISFYQTLSTTTKELRSTQVFERNPVSQKRKMIEKELWTIDDKQRTCLKILADTSELHVKKQKEFVEACEHLTKLTCIYEDKNLQTLHAEKGSLHLPEQSLDVFCLEYTHPKGIIKAGHGHFAKHAELLFHNHVEMLGQRDGLKIQSERAVCHLEDETCDFMDKVHIDLTPSIWAQGDFAKYEKEQLELFPHQEGVCSLYRNKSDSQESAWLGASQDRFLQMNADASSDLDLDQIHAAKIGFHFATEEIVCEKPKGSFQSSDGKRIHFSGNQLLFQKQKGLLQLNENVAIASLDEYFIQANHAYLTTCKDQVNRVEVEGVVQLYCPHLNQKESFALADHVTLDPETKKVILKADGDRRVLFWQEGLSLSAPEINILQNRVEGKGDVHCTLTLEEQNSINQLIAKYL